MMSNRIETLPFYMFLKFNSHILSFGFRLVPSSFILKSRVAAILQYSENSNYKAGS